MEPDPFKESYDEYVHVVFNYLMGLTLNPELSEELTQDTFVKAYKSIDTFDGRCKMSVWLCQIAKNSYFSYRKKERRKTSLDVQQHEDDSTLDVANALMNADEAMSVHRVIQRLGQPYKEVFYLRFFAELSYAQISEILGKSESWARVTFYRAKEKIKQSFHQEESQ